MATTTEFQKQMDDGCIARALGLVKARVMLRHSDSVQDEESIKSLFVLQIGELPYEVFCAAYFNKYGQLLTTVRLTRGTVDECKVYVRELVREAIVHNATSVVIAHNHPQGGKSFSMSDIDLTCRAKAALDTVDIRLIDHLLVAEGSAISYFASKGN